MKKWVICLIFFCFVLIFCSCASLPSEMTPDDAKSAIGNITISWTSFNFFHIPQSNEYIRKKALTLLRKEAEKKGFVGDYDIKIVSVEQHASGWTALLTSYNLIADIRKTVAIGTIVQNFPVSIAAVLSEKDTNTTTVVAQVQPAIPPTRPGYNSHSPQKYALVIGNGNYTSFGRLPNALNDANDMKTTLEVLGFTVDIVTDGSRAQMAESIARLKNKLSVSKNSYGFFFYAGHGLQHNGINYLIPARAEIPNANYLGDTSISVQTLLAELNDAGNDLNVIVLDACRDFPAAWSRSLNRGLTVVANQPADSIIVYATTAGSTASDGTGRNGLFTSHLLKNLRTPGLEITEIFRLTGADVSQSSNRQQIPAIYNQFFGRAYLGIQP